MRFLLIGDVVGRPGRKCLHDLLPQIRINYQVDFTIANGENLASGTGINKKTAEELFESGVDFITTGNHVWDKKEAIEYLDKEQRIIRPLNYPPQAPGRGYAITECKGIKIGIINTSGRVYMPALDCPFRTVAEAVQTIRKQTKIIIVDFHAEATSEKIALGRYLDGNVSAVVGTHTHVQTADERILRGGTAYITDLGMTGPVESVLGMDPEKVMTKFLTQMPVRFEVASKGPLQFNGVLIDVDENTGLATGISRLTDYHEL